MEVKIAGLDDSELISTIIVSANQTIAERYGITKENSKNHPSNCKESWIIDSISKGEVYFLCVIDDIPVGTVAYKVKGDSVILKNLAVVPEYQNRGVGRFLVEHFISYIQEYAKEQEVSEITLGLIDENSKLKEWYKKIGFRVGKIKKFSHLPYRICFMKLTLYRSHNPQPAHQY